MVIFEEFLKDSNFYKLQPQIQGQQFFHLFWEFFQSHEKTLESIAMVIFEEFTKKWNKFCVPKILKIVALGMRQQFSMFWAFLQSLGKTLQSMASALQWSCLKILKQIKQNWNQIFCVQKSRNLSLGNKSNNYALF